MTKKSRPLDGESWSLDEVQRMVVDPNEIISLVYEMNVRRQEQHEVEWFTCMASLFDRYPDDAPRIFCINERMQAFLPLMDDRRMHGWTFAGLEEGCAITNESIFRAIARCPLRANDEGTWFDPDEFFQKTLLETEPEGHA